MKVTRYILVLVLICGSLGFGEPTEEDKPESGTSGGICAWQIAKVAGVIATVVAVDEGIERTSPEFHEEVWREYTGLNWLDDQLTYLAKRYFDGETGDSPSTSNSGQSDSSEGGNPGGVTLENPQPGQIEGSNPEDPDSNTSFVGRISDEIKRLVKQDEGIKAARKLAVDKAFNKIISESDVEDRIKALGKKAEPILVELKSELRKKLESELKSIEAPSSYDLAPVKAWWEKRITAAIKDNISP